MEQSSQVKELREKTMSAVFLVSALVSIFATGLICVFLFANGIPAIWKIGFGEFLLGTEWSPVDEPPLFGILPMIVGSLYVTAGAIIIGAPIGILSAVFLARAATKKIYRVIKPCVELLAGVPSVVYGFFGMAAIVPFVDNSILAASILLGIMILPTIAAIAESAIRAVPNQYYEGALALGSGHYRSVFFVLLPAAKSGILAAVILGVGRAIGETMAVIMVAGNQARMPSSIMDGARTLTANIVLEMGYAADLHREALIAAGAVLFVFILMINLSFSALKARSRI
ncbi:MAG: phosphate ABC transporter permease subunit PstC [Helicobacteraceae bacterium]|jgi:phosphate transport system permease protein|nr:phosphate ABC transporter permease subunit PstC [Helicobacteraceae bacterium]